MKNASKKISTNRSKQKKLPPKVRLYLDEEVLHYFKSTGSGWQSRINNFLKAAVTNLVV